MVRCDYLQLFLLLLIAPYYESACAGGCVGFQQGGNPGEPPAPLYSGAAIKNAMYGILFPYTAQGSFGNRKNLKTSLCTKCDERSIIMFANVRDFPLWYGGLLSVSQEAGGRNICFCVCFLLCLYENYNPFNAILQHHFKLIFRFCVYFMYFQ